jgi:probable F420-dependent oxidoreductase
VLLGAVFPQIEIGADAGAVREWTQAVEELGYDHVLVYDHILGADTTNRPEWRGAYTAQTTFHEVMVVLGFMAALTSRVGLVTSIVVAPQRQTALLAKQAAALDVLSGGRMRLGVGIGWNAVEYEALGADFATRAARLEEQIELLRLLWREPVVSYRGLWHTINEAGINPLPVRRSIPLWMGAHAEAGIRRAARLADGIFPVNVQDPAGYVERLRGWLAEAGRDPNAFGVEPWVPTTSPRASEWQRSASEWQEAGATHLAVYTTDAGLSGPAQHIERLREVAETLL